MLNLEFRPRRASRWRAGTLIGVHVLIVGHVAHWLVNGTTLAGIGPDAAMDLGKSGIVNVGLLIFLGLILATAIFGRFFCGWACHLIALQDLCRWLLIKVGIRPRPLRSRLLLLVPPIAFVYMFFWPAAFRWIAGYRFDELQTEWTTTDLWGGLPGWGIGVLTLVCCGFVIVYVLGSKGFCTYACPYGAVFGFADRLAVLRVRTTSECRSCACCTAACTSNVRVHEHVRDFGMVVDSRCMKCLDCVGSCPTGALHLGVGRPAFGAQPRAGHDRPRGSWNVSWSEEILLVTLFALAFLTFRGLYTMVPFLMSLGVSGILAMLGLVAVRLVGRDDLRFGGLRLRRDGKLTGAGWAFGGLMVCVVAFWSHSAVVRLHEVGGAFLYRQTEDLRVSALNLGTPLYLAQGTDRQIVDRAIRVFDRSRRWGLVANPSTPLKLAWLHLLAGHERAFAEQIGAALVTQPGAAEVHLLRAREHAATRRFHDAIEAYSEAIECEPLRADGYLSLGALLAGLGRLDSAVEVFDRGIKVLPDDADLQYNSGVAHAMRRDFEVAVEHFEKALTINPDHLKAKENLEGLLAFAGGR